MLTIVQLDESKNIKISMKVHHPEGIITVSKDFTFLLNSFIHMPLIEILN